MLEEEVLIYRMGLWQEEWQSPLLLLVMELCFCLMDIHGGRLPLVPYYVVSIANRPAHQRYRMASHTNRTATRWLYHHRADAQGLPSPPRRRPGHQW